jgi:outer membrane protein assembly factor BamB
MKTMRLLVSAFTVCILVSVPSSDSSQWTEYLANSQRTGYSADNGPEVPFLLWEVNLSGSFDTPFILEDNVLILWKDSRHHALKEKVLLIDLLTGDILQEFNQSGPIIFSIAFPVNDQIIGTCGGNIYEVDLAKTEVTQVAKTPEKGPHMYPIILKDKIIISTMPVVCLSTSNFDTIWTLEDAAVAPDFRPLSLAGNEHISAFLMTENGVPQLLVVEPTGMLKWVSDPLPAALWLTLGENSIYCGGRNLWAFDYSGKEIWHYTPEERIVSNIVLGPKDAFFADCAHNLYRVDSQGNLVWRTGYEGSSSFLETHLVGAGDSLYCIGNLGDNPADITKSYVAAYSMEDGSQMWNLEFGSSHHIKAPPAVAGGILVVGKNNGEMIALASDPDLFLEQGDAFLSNGLKDQAIDSYEKAAQLYEKEGDLDKSQELQEKISELEDQREPTIEPSVPPESPPVISNFFIVGIAVLAITLFGIFIVYYFVKHKKL